jgi:Tfp pilus assembly protein PilF
MRNFTWKNQGSIWIDALEEAPGQLRVHHNLGRFYQNQGFNKKAIEEYKKALQAPIRHRRDEAIVTYHNLAKLYTDMGDLENGKRYYEQAIMMSPRFIPAYNNLAAIFDRLGERESANALLRNVLEMNPADGHANLNMGLFHLRGKEPDKAIEHLNKMREAKPLEGDRMLYLGIAYKQMGDFGKAVGYFRNVLDKGHRAVDVRLHLAEIYVRSNRPDKAEREIETAIRLLARNLERFPQFIRRLTNDDELSHIEPCAEIILPLISKALDKKSREFKAWKDQVDENIKNRRDTKAP